MVNLGEAAKHCKLAPYFLLLVSAWLQKAHILCSYSLCAVQRQIGGWSGALSPAWEQMSSQESHCDSTAKHVPDLAWSLISMAFVTPNYMTQASLYQLLEISGFAEEILGE